MDDKIIKGVDTPIDEINDKSDTLSNKTTLNISAASLIIRILGTLIILSGALIYISQKWSGYTDPQKYLALIATTIFIATAGFFLSLKIKGSRISRVLLVIAIALAPMHFSQLGSFIFSYFKQRIPAIAIDSHWRTPDIFTWQTDSGIYLTLLTMWTFVIISTISYCAFSTFYHSKVKFITVLYLFLNTILLIPLKGEICVTIFATIMLGVLIYSLLTQFRGESADKTAAVNVVNFLLSMPLFVLIFRALYDYSELTDFFIGILCEIVAIALFVIASRSDKEDSLASAFHFIAAICAAIGCWFIEDGIITGRLDYTSLTFLLPPAFIVATAGIFAPKNKGLYFTIAFFVAIIATSFQIVESNLNRHRAGATTSLVLGLLTSLTSGCYACLINSKKNLFLMLFSIFQLIFVFFMATL